MYVRTPSVTLCIVRMCGLEIHPSPNILPSSLFLNTLNIRMFFLRVWRHVWYPCQSTAGGKADKFQ